jgi:hypothetical protein
VVVLGTLGASWTQIRMERARRLERP